MSVDTSRLERAIGTVLRTGVMVSSAFLTAGLLMSLTLGGEAIAGFLLNAGIIILLMTPVARVIVSIVQYALERDWTFTTLTLIVLAELTASLIAALYGRKS